MMWYGMVWLFQKLKKATSCIDDKANVSLNNQEIIRQFVFDEDECQDFCFAQSYISNIYTLIKKESLLKS